MESKTQQASNVNLLEAYDAAGFKMIRLRADDKKCIDKGWQLDQNRISLEDAVAWAADGGGIGMQGGETSRWACAVDLDSAEAKKLAPRFLRPTLTIGKEADELPGAYVYISEGADYRKIKDVDPDPERGEVLCVKASNQGKGHQFVVPPSMHPTKGRYVWSEEFDAAKIARIGSDELDMHVSHLGAAALIAHNLPRSGRHDYAMAVAGLLGYNGEEIETARALMQPAWDLAGAPQDALRDLEAIIEDTYERLAASEPVIGGKTLNDIVPRLAQKIGTALRWSNPRGVVHKKYARTEMGNAERLVDTFGEHIRYCYPWKAWLLWDGHRWVRDEGGRIIRRAKAVARAIHEDAARALDEKEQRDIGKWAIQSQSEQKINSMINLARSEVSIAPDELDTDPMLLTVLNGTLDLRTGELRASRPEDFITKMAPVEYDPDAVAPRFAQFLREVLVTDDLIGFVRRYAGYTLTGSTEERAIAILHGAGRNGKSTLVELLRYVMGDYAQSTDVETILAKRYQGVGNDVAALKGARFVSTSEIEQGRRLAESKVKQLTGGDTVTARFLFSEPFDFKPQFKLWISTNNKPEIQGNDNAIWDRIRLIPFEQRFEGENVDTQLPRKLRDEAAGVLAWMVRGCLEWKRDGLGTAEAVEAATDEYREEMDTFALFIDEECVKGPDKWATAAALYDAYTRWCLRSGEAEQSKKKFGQSMKSHGYTSGQVSSGADRGKKTWKGVGLLSNEPDPDERSATAWASTSQSATPEKPVDKPKSPPDSVSVADVADKSKTFASEKPRVRKVVKSRATSAASATDDGVDPEQRVRGLVQQGMSEKWARAEVEGDSPKVEPPFAFELDGVKWEYGILEDGTEGTGRKVLPERHEGETDEEYRARVKRGLDELVGGADA